MTFPCWQQMDFRTLKVLNGRKNSPAPRKGRIARIEFTMFDLVHTFCRGYRLMVHARNSRFPLVRNLQPFVPNIACAKPEDFRKATHRVYRSASAPSSLTVGILPEAR